MTDMETLMGHRMQQADETLQDAIAMLHGDFSPRSIVNRSYYAVFYAVLALFLSEGIAVRTSKHSGIISVFNKECVLTGKIDRRHSKTLQRLFDARQEGDYKELAVVTRDEAARYVVMAEELISAIKLLIEQKNDRDGLKR